MREPIKVGDLVMVIRWGHKHGPMGRDPNPGTPYIVTLLDKATCTVCGESLGMGAAGHDGRGVPVSWLRKIDPQAELDDVKQDEEITA